MKRTTSHITALQDRKHCALTVLFIYSPLVLLMGFGAAISL